jgi:hypothetical protein
MLAKAMAATSVTERRWTDSCAESFSSADTFVSVDVNLKEVSSMNVSGRFRVGVFVSVVLLGTVAMASPSESGYHLVKSVPIGGTRRQRVL